MFLSLALSQQYHSTGLFTSNVAVDRPTEQLLLRPAWIGSKCFLRTPKPINPLSSDVQIDMDGLGHGFCLVDPNWSCALLCNPSGRGTQPGSQPVQFKSDKIGGNKRRRPSRMVSSA